MPSWGEVLSEIQQEQRELEQLRQQGQQVPNAADVIRHKYLGALAQKTGRNVIVYASGWLQKSQLPPDHVLVHPSDIDGFLEVVKACDRTLPLDLILHSPGGSPEAAEQIVNYLRQKFAHIRVIVPHMAMSAATMMACAADIVVLARHSTLGPTDPQIQIRTNTGELRVVPAHALKDDFKAAQRAGPNGNMAWAPILGQYPPGLLAQCDMSLKLTRHLVTTWLKNYMFKDDKNAKRKATEIARFFADKTHYTHGRPLMRDLLKSKGLKIEDLEDDQEFQDLVMSTYHATTHTLGGTLATKIIDSHVGKAYFKQFQPRPVPAPRA